MPEVFVAQILRELGRAGIVAGRRGAGGGFRLVVPAEEVSVLAVVEALDGAPWAPEAPSSDPDAPLAVLRVWEEARAALEGVLARHTIAELAAEEGRGFDGGLPSEQEEETKTGGDLGEGAARAGRAAPQRGAGAGGARPARAVGEDTARGADRGVGPEGRTTDCRGLPHDPGDAPP